MLAKNGHANESVQIIRKAEVILKELNGDGERLADLYRAMANSLSDACKYEEAIPLHNKALKLFRKCGSPSPYDLMSCANNIGNIYFAWGDY